MESTRPRPAGVVDAATVPDVAAVFDASAPFVSVYLPTDPAVDNAGPRNEVRWKGIRQELLEAGAPEAALGAIDQLVPDAHTRGAALVAIANAAGLRLVRHEPEPPRRELARVDPLPRLGPVLEWEQAAVPHVIVLADRVGADLAALTAAGRQILDSVGGADSGEPMVRRSPPGGWSQRRYQQRAENLWEERAGEAAEAVADLVDRIGARLVVAAGDVRATQLLQESLPARINELLEIVDGSRAVDGGLDELAEESVRLASSVAASDTVACLQRLREETGREEGLAVQGVEPTLAALAEARVDTLMVHDDPDDDRTAWYGPEPALVAAHPEPLRELGVEDPARARLVDVALRGALGTGAGVRMVPKVPSDGLAALLRY